MRYFFRRRPAPLTRIHTFVSLTNPLGTNEGSRDPVFPGFPYVPADAVRLEGTAIGNVGFIPAPTSYTFLGTDEAKCGTLPPP